MRASALLMLMEITALSDGCCLDRTLNSIRQSHNACVDGKSEPDKSKALLGDSFLFHVQCLQDEKQKERERQKMSQNTLVMFLMVVRP